MFAFYYFRCECDDDHIGTHCENPKPAPCMLEPCYPGQGDCEETNQTITGYRCNCFKGYWGDHCEIGS